MKRYTLHLTVELEHVWNGGPSDYNPPEHYVEDLVRCVLLASHTLNTPASEFRPQVRWSVLGVTAEQG